MGCLLTRTKVSPTDDNKEFYGDDFIKKSRTCTDILWLILMILFFLGHGYFLNYCFRNGDMKRMLNGYDFCGNICGVKNEPDPKFPCKGTDHTENKYYLIEIPDLPFISRSLINRKCVKSCENELGFKPFLNRCIKDDKSSMQLSVRSFFSKTGISEILEDISEDILSCWLEIVLLFIIAFILSLLTVFFLRYIVGSFVWLLLIGTILVALGATIFFWVQYYGAVHVATRSFVDERDENTWLTFAIIGTIVTVLIILIIFVLRKRISLLIELIREAGKALCKMPALLFEPLLTFFAFTILCVIWLYCQIWIESSGILTMDSNNSAEYVKDRTIIVARWYNIFVFVWMSYFFIGCQHMIIAGSVAIWFFTRNKDNLHKPLISSIKILLFYHLGTVAIGSFLITILKAIRYVIKRICDRFKKFLNPQATFCMKCLCYPFQCCLYCFDKFLQYITRNAYIVTSIYGYPFCKAAKTSFQILVSNALRVATINSVGDFILLLAKLFVTFLTGLIGVLLMEQHQDLHYKWAPVIIAVIFAYLTSHCFISVYEMTIDTIFICFCVDCETNDGLTKPYFMSRGLMEFVQNSKKVLGVNENASKGKTAWSLTNINDSNNNNNKNYYNNKITTISETVN